MKLEFSRQIYAKYAEIKFNENPSCGSRVVACGQRDRQTRLIAGFRNFAKAPKNGPQSQDLLRWVTVFRITL